jgi:hypothetical protein
MHMHKYCSSLSSTCIHAYINAHTYLEKILEMKYLTSKHKTGFNFRRHIVEASTTFVGDGTHYNNGKTGLLHFLTYTHIYTPYIHITHSSIHT